MRQTKRPESIDPGFRSPDVQPEGTICARVYIPDDNLHIAAFWGHVEALTKWISWQRGGTKAKEAAEAWKAAWELSRAAWEQCAGECGIVDVRQNETTPCLLDKKVDCETWEQFADMRLCVPRMRIRDGKIQQDTTGSDDWQDTSEETTDERISGDVTPAYPEEPPDAACLSALNAYQFIMKRVNEIAEANASYDDFLTVFSVLVAGLAILSGVGVVVVLIAGALMALLDTFAGDWSDVVGLDLTEDILCPLRKAFLTNGDGTMSEADWETLKTDIDATRTGKPDYEMVALALVGMVVDAVGPVGMSRMANVAGVTSGTCPCVTADWRHDFDFRVSMDGWTIDSTGGYPTGVFNEGVGLVGVWAGGVNGSYKAWVDADAIPSTQILEIAYLAEYAPDEDYYSYVLLSAGNEIFIDETIYSPDPLHASGWRHGDGDEFSLSCRLRLARTHQGSPTPSDGDQGGITLKRVIVWGMGDDPFL